MSIPLGPLTINDQARLNQSISSTFQVIEYMEIRNHENTYKSQRAAYNGFVRADRIRIAPYQIIDHDAWFTLFHRWAHQKEDIPTSRSGPKEDMARMMLRDAARAHRVTLQEYHELGLTGRIVWVDGAVKAYTFGFPRSPEVFCVLLEVSIDQSVV